MFTLEDIFLCWGILSLLIFCFLVLPCCVAAARSDEIAGCK